MQAIQDTLRLLEPLYNKAIIALILLLLGFIIGKLIGKIVQKVLSEIELNRLIKKATGFNIRLESFAGNLVQYFIYFIFIMWTLEQLGLGSMILNIVAGGVILIIIISIVLAIKDFVPNAIAGIYIQLKGIIRPGDQVRMENISGTIESIDMIETRLQTRDDIIYVPNSTILKSMIRKRKGKEKN